MSKNDCECKDELKRLKDVVKTYEVAHKGNPYIIGMMTGLDLAIYILENGWVEK